MGDWGLIPGSGRSPGEGNGNPLQYPCLENPMDRGYSPVGLQRVRHDWATNTFTSGNTNIHGKRKSLLATVYCLLIFPVSLSFLIHLLLSAPTHTHPNTLIFSLDFWYEAQLLIRLRARLVKSMLNLHGGSHEVARRVRKPQSTEQLLCSVLEILFFCYQKKEWEKCCRSDLCFLYFSQDLSPKGHVRKTTW